MASIVSLPTCRANCGTTSARVSIPCISYPRWLSIPPSYMNMCIANSTSTPTTSFNPHPHTLLHCSSLSFTPSNVHFPPLPTERTSSFDASMTTYIHDLYLFPIQTSRGAVPPIANFGPPLSRSLLSVSTRRQPLVHIPSAFSFPACISVSRRTLLAQPPFPAHHAPVSIESWQTSDRSSTLMRNTTMLA